MERGAHVPGESLALVLIMLTEDLPSSIMLVLDPALYKGEPAASQAFAIPILAAALQSMTSSASQAWTIEPLQEDATLSFALKPLPGQPISPTDVQLLTGALRAQPTVLAATLIV